MQQRKLVLGLGFLGFLGLVFSSLAKYYSGTFELTESCDVYLQQLENAVDPVGRSNALSMYNSCSSSELVNSVNRGMQRATVFMYLSLFCTLVFFGLGVTFVVRNWKQIKSGDGKSIRGRKQRVEM